MNIQELQTLYARLPQVKALSAALEKDQSPVFLDGLLASSAPMLFSALATRCAATMLFVLQDADEAGYFYHDLCQVMGQQQVLFFPSSYRRAIKYAQKDAASEILRTEALSRLSQQGAIQSEPCYIVSHPEALAEMVVTRKNLDDRTLLLEQGQTVVVGDFCARLRQLGFREVDYVYEAGQFALRGSILDIYSFSHEYPYRVDFFGDEIDSIRTFEVDDQLSRERCQRIEIVPELSTVEEKESLLKFMPPQSVLVVKDYLYVRDAIDRTYQAGFSDQALLERTTGATEMEQREIERELQRDSRIITGAQFMADSQPFRRIEFGHRPSSQPRTTIRFHITVQPLFHKSFDLLAKTFEDYQLRGYTVYVLADSQKQNERLQEILTSSVFTPVDKTLHAGFADDDLRVCLFTDHQIFDRFHKYNLKSDKARSGKVALTLKEIQQFELGDYVVHVDHGVGKFGGLVRMPLGDGRHQEMIKIIYQRGDAIYVSIHSLYKVSKYKSPDDGQPPRMSTLGTGQWERLKERTKTHIKTIARDLIRLYAARRRQRGFAFSHDTYLQHELEASFLYEDTPDQLKATQDVKADMEQPRPMDRLVCGDVGFGKTEVAVRAAFKAAVDGKQVAVLVPTTVLAYQHYRTFASRLKDMPVRVDYLTRARTARQTRSVLSDLEAGKIDILIGTHKLIGKSVHFHDLGLLIIDEEQKFGVATKEKLRQLKTSVDTLTMSATPIPRTLQFSLVGARDLSVIKTPPPNRYPIQTEIHTFSPEIIADAVNFELSRNGQVYFVNNRISDLTHIAQLIRHHVPDARVAVGHGQMKPEELEQIILDFANHDTDVLLSTTIVENGIDIPNANTIIINSAHHFGLSDLHQMRGRVGRGNRKAFCYLLAPPLAALSPQARRRLEALENFSDLGSGINIAMQDLDLRGAGNLLGAEQSGFISDLGYETYQKILNEAMAELRNEGTDGPDSPAPGPVPSAEGTVHPQTPEGAQQQGGESPFSRHGAGDETFVADCTLESDLEMYFPDRYVPSDSERMLLYRELDSVRDDRELLAYRARLQDRFGPLPHVAEELLQVVPLRRHGMQLGCEQIMLKQGRMFLFFVSNPQSPFYQSQAFGRLLDYVGRHASRCNFRDQQGRRSLVVSQVPTVEEAVRVLQDIK